jgi:hypothetical protein
MEAEGSYETSVTTCEASRVTDQKTTTQIFTTVKTSCSELTGGIYDSIDTIDICGLVCGHFIKSLKAAGNVKT